SGGSEQISPWRRSVCKSTMWREITRHLGSYPSAVLTGYDASGYPFSVRCRPKVDAAARIIRVDVPAEAGLKPGPASLLCHSHNQASVELAELPPSWRPRTG